MKKKRFDTQTAPELLFVDRSSQDSKGKRVLVRDDSGCENWIFPEDGTSEADRRLLGLTERDQKHIERFFQQDSAC
jgi:hypothetical protein